MESLPEPASRLGPRWLLLLPLLLLLLLPAPELGPSQAQAEETDWVRLPSKCEGEGAGPAGVSYWRGGACGEESGWKALGENLFIKPTVCLALCRTLRIQGREREQVSVHLELTTW